MTDPDRSALPWLVRLMSSGAPVDGLSDSQLIEAVRMARQARKDAEGRAAAELHRRGWTWEKIGDALGVAQSTVHRWASPYLVLNDQSRPPAEGPPHERHGLPEQDA